MIPVTKELSEHKIEYTENKSYQYSLKKTSKRKSEF